MSIYTDGTHIVGDSIEELHLFADKLGFKRAWFQDKPGKPHYDALTLSKKTLALKLGAIQVTSKWIVTFLKETYCQHTPDSDDSSICGLCGNENIYNQLP